ncbi:SPOR domain-containing protein [Glaciecola petra]|uniref:SPOR domain-containing protein n=1 Tax=Glaciecola petra TaxID=3075602 RepID=A0ABU2ZMJ6_9ALTE|nr:SPOR domain-containing protein [Aestuariibacter sp. P117]MDT0593847.1 SPOR domain-containing protein [Aestuariibacter sp. P117]
MKKNIVLNNHHSLLSRYFHNSSSNNGFLLKPIRLCIMSVCFVSLAGCFSFGNSETAAPDKTRNSQLYVEQSRTIEKLNQKIEDINKLEAEIARLAKYESEFSYMFEQLNALNSPINSASFSNTKSADLISQPMDNLISTNQTQMDVQQGDSSEIGQVFKTNQKTAVVPSYTSSKIDTSSVEVGVADNKFKSIAQTSVQTNETIDAKFASLGASPQAQPASIQGRSSFSSNINNDNCKTISGRFALHLVSYSSAAKANNGWKDLNNKIADITCDRSARIQKVYVNNKTFYSVRVGPYDSDKDARAVCSLIAKRGHYCGVSEYVGNAI